MSLFLNCDMCVCYRVIGIFYLSLIFLKVLPSEVTFHKSIYSFVEC